jgi:pilus assembly protein CpaB
MAGLAVVFGATSYYAGNEYLDSQARARLSQLENENGTSHGLANVVVASAPLQFGDELLAEKLKIVPWPKDALPEGAYSSVEEAIGKGERKVIKSIEINEPVLVVKLSGEDGRAGLAGLIADGMRAVTIPVDLVKGVGGFVMPGDRVDIVFTQRDKQSGEQTAEIIMESVKVLSVDQQADSRANAPKAAKSVTLETDTAGAQQLALASDVGQLSLLLRSAGDQASVNASAISLGGKPTNDTEEGSLSKPDKSNFLSFLQQPEKMQTTIKVVRGEDVNDAVVPIQKMIKPSDQAK